MSDDQIISSITDGNIAAFEQLYNCTYKNVYAFIFSMVKCRHTTEDLMHDTYMRIFEKASTYQIGTSLQTWIMTLAKNITYDYFRKVKPFVPFEDNGGENITFYLPGSCENVIEHIELEKALEKLSELDSQIAVLYAVCGYKHKEIAQILSIPEGTIRRRYRGAIKQLANAMRGAVDG
ncbi:MAG: RNA polymerase sigma factor [Ruminiclostridium sp.]|nr:RNA polymerase sigma factor [Ruminiclostridium sp.]